MDWQLPSKATDYRVTLNAREVRDYLRDLIIWARLLIFMGVITWVKRPQISASIISNIPFIFVINKNILNRKAPAVKYDHTASSGGLRPLPGQQ